ncbi:hypothetical protein P9112_001963 [Eukaryota sp. TZLM1-RC]
MLRCPCSNISIDVENITSLALNGYVSAKYLKDPVIKFPELSQLIPHNRLSIYICRICGPVFALVEYTQSLLAYKCLTDPLTPVEPVSKVFGIEVPSHMVNQVPNDYCSIHESLLHTFSSFLDKEYVEMRSRIQQFIKEQEEEYNNLSTQLQRAAKNLSSMTSSYSLDDASVKAFTDIVSVHQRAETPIKPRQFGSSDSYGTSKVGHLSESDSSYETVNRILGDLSPCPSSPSVMVGVSAPREVSTLSGTRNSVENYNSMSSEELEKTFETSRSVAGFRRMSIVD